MVSDCSDIFWYGVVVGMILALVVGGVFTRATIFQRTWRARYRPFDTFPDTTQPNLTPASIYWSSCTSGITLVIVLVIGIAGIVLACQNQQLINDMLVVFFPS